MVLSGNVTNFQFLLRQEKQLAEIQTSGLQNHVRISQLLQRNSGCTCSWSGWISLVAALDGCNHYPVVCNRYTTSEQVQIAGDLLYLRQNLWETAVCLHL